MRDLVSFGTVSYITHKHKGSFMHTIQPHVQYVYEIEIGPGRPAGIAL